MNKMMIRNSTKNCTNRNALLARQNRIKKKLYIESLEKEIAKLKSSKMKLNSIVNNQSSLISELRQEVKYMKSILANSSDLSNLVKNIHASTGMSVSTSLDKTVILNNCVSKQNDKQELKHPWEDFDCHLEPSDLDLGLTLSNSLWDTNLDDFITNDIDSSTYAATLDEHNYTSKSKSDEEIPGVCLHVNKHRVSLEFCAACHDNASETWKEEKID